MDVLRESRYIISSFIIIIVCWLGWLCGLVFGEVVGALTSAVNFPDVALLCLANLAVFFKLILRDKHSYETVAKERMVVIKNVKESSINGLNVMTTNGKMPRECSVVMLSFHYPATSGARKFMDSISNAFDVHAIFLRCRPLQFGALTEDFRNCRCPEKRDGRCGCIVFNTAEDITMMLARQLPGTLKILPDSRCLIPSVCCLSKGCHGCNQGLLHVENDRLEEGDPNLESPAAVCEILESIPKVDACICIPVRPFNEDEWTNELIRVFEPQKGEFRGVVFREGGTNASSALENYKKRNGECDADETYSFASLAIVPYLAEPLINFVLTFLFKVDGFSSAVFAKRSVSTYLFPRLLPGRQFSPPIFPHKYLTRARVKSNANNTNVCQVFFFRPAFQLSIMHTLWFLSACICCIGWTALVAKEGRADQWYDVPSMPPSEGRIIVIMVAITIALAMDAFDLKLYLQIRRWPGFRQFCPRKIFTFHKSCRLIIDRANIILFCATIGLQLLYIVGCIAIGRFVGIKAFGRWIYSALQCLVVVKWATSFLIADNCEYAIRQDSPEDGKPMWWYGTCGHYIRASVFLLNATMAGVRAEWKFS